MTSIYLTFNFRYDQNTISQRVQSLNTGHIHVLISCLYKKKTEVTLFSMTEDKLQDD